MRVYWEVAKKNFQAQMAYRTANIAGLFTNLFFGVLRAFLFIALFEARPQVAGWTVGDALTYTALTQALFTPLAVYGWWAMSLTIPTGAVVSDLSRPFDFFTYWFARDLGRAIYQLLWRGLPVMLLFALFFEINTPATPAHYLLFLISLLLALGVSFAWHFAVNTLAFWFVDIYGLGTILFMIGTFFSGFVIPVDFFPPWLAAIAQATPFPSMINTPMQVYLGVISGPELIWRLAMQMIWLVSLIGLSQWLIHLGRRKLVIQGG